MSVAIQDGSGEYAATIVSGANLHIDPARLTDAAVWADVGLVILQSEVPEAVNIAAARAARQRGIATILNAAPFRDLSADLRGLVDVLVVNAVEAEMMGTCRVCCLNSASDAARHLAARFDAVIVTAGSAGLAAWSAGGAQFQIAAENVEVVSSHGAGDAFIGTLAARLAAGGSLREACQAASIAAAEHVAGLGKTVQSTPD